MARLFDHAIAFAQPILRADAAADLGEGVGGLRNLIGLLQTSLGGQAQPVGDVVVQGAMRLAVRHAALAAAARLLGGLLGSELAVNLMEIAGAHRGITLGGHLFAQAYELQHLLRGHGCAPKLLGYRRRDTLDRLGIKVSMRDLFGCFSPLMGSKRTNW